MKRYLALLLAFFLSGQAMADMIGSDLIGVEPASSTGPFVTIGNDAGLTDERALTGTKNQITVTDNGANSTVVLSTPQDLDTDADFQIGSLAVNTTNSVSTYDVKIQQTGDDLHVGIACIEEATPNRSCFQVLRNDGTIRHSSNYGDGFFIYDSLKIDGTAGVASDNTKLIIIPAAGQTNFIMDAYDPVALNRVQITSDGLLNLKSTTYNVKFDVSSSATQDYTLTWPVDNGAADEIMVTDGSGVLDFATLGGDVTGSVASTVVADNSHDHTTLTGTAQTTWTIDSANAAGAVEIGVGIVLDGGSGTDWTFGSNGAANAFECFQGAAGTTLALGRTTDTGQSEIVIVDGGADNEPGTIQTYSDAGTGYRWWVATSGVPRLAAAAITDDDADGNAFVMDNTALGGDATGTVGAV